MLLTSPLVALVALLAGFHVGPRLAPAASFVAHKPVTVLCANTPYDWLTYVTDNYGSSDPELGLTQPGSSEEHLNPSVCSALASALAVKKTRRVAPTARLGVAILVLVHESIHARGEPDEAKTDCAASHEMPRVAVKFFRIRPGKDLRSMMGAVQKWRKAEAPVYLTVC